MTTVTNRLEGQRVLITAGAAGIGLAIASRLTEEGAKVALCDVDAAALQAASTLLPEAFVHPADVTDEAAIATFVDKTVGVLGGIDALINNAGIAGPTGAVEALSIADWRRTVDVCLVGQFILAHHVVPHLKAAGGGSIVNMSSAAGKHGYAFRTPYSAAKFGVIGFTESLAKELGPHAIRVNAILPGIVEGARMDGVIENRAAELGISFDEMRERYLQNVSLRAMVTADDVAAMVAMLLSADGRFITGQSIGVDGNVETL